MFGFENLQRRMNGLVREGVVSEIYPERCSCRVTFADRSNLVSAEMPILMPFAYKNKFYRMPDVGESVVCLTASNDMTGGGGYVIGSLYTGDNPPPEADENVTKLEFDDQTYISYNRATHEFRIQFSDKSEIVFDGENSELSLKIKGNIMVDGEARLEVSTRDEVNIDSRADINLQGRNIRLN